MKSKSLLFNAGVLVFVSMGCGTSASTVVVTPCVDSDTMPAENCRAERLGAESVGGLALEMTFDALVARLGEPAEVSETHEEGATGYIVRTLAWPAVGVSIDTSRNHADAPEVAYRIHVEAPFAGKTGRNIGIGSSEADVRAAYAGMADPDHTRAGENFVAGSIYGGVIFTFTAGRVSAVFIGAGAE